MDPATECAKFSGELLRRKKPPATKKSCGGSSEIAELSWRRRGERRYGGWMRCEQAGGERPGYI
jgi:hypothetical protein